MAVFVLDKRKQPLMPCSEKRARLLLERCRAVVVRRYPFTIRLKDRIGGETQPLRLSIDPGSQTTGMALTRDEGDDRHVLTLFELRHRGRQIREGLDDRRGNRRHRRSKLRHRPARFNNRTRPKGWLAPSLQHRVDTTTAWVNRLRRLVPITVIGQELVRFDTQKMADPEIAGVEYQQGTLAGYEVREYLLEKWRRQCAYCDKTNLPLQIDHIHPRSKGGSDQVSNLTLACKRCNQDKGHQPVEQFLAHEPKRLVRIRAQQKAPLRDAATVNATRWALYRALVATGLPVEVGTGGQTKYNRHRLGIPKTHALDGACVGQFNTLHNWQIPTLAIAATGRGQYRRTLRYKCGFPRAYLMRQKQVRGFQTGDMVLAVVPSDQKNAGTHVGRIGVRKTGSFSIRTQNGLADGVNAQYCTLIHRSDGYGYHHQPLTQPQGGRETTAA